MDILKAIKQLEDYIEWCNGDISTDTDRAVLCIVNFSKKAIHTLQKQEEVISELKKQLEQNGKHG